MPDEHVLDLAPRLRDQVQVADAGPRGSPGSVTSRRSSLEAVLDPARVERAGALLDQRLERPAGLVAPAADLGALFGRQAGDRAQDGRSAPPCGRGSGPAAPPPARASWPPAPRARPPRRAARGARPRGRCRRSGGSAMVGRQSMNRGFVQAERRGHGDVERLGPAAGERHVAPLVACSTRRPGKPGPLGAEREQHRPAAAERRRSGRPAPGTRAIGPPPRRARPAPGPGRAGDRHAEHGTHRGPHRLGAERVGRPRAQHHACGAERERGAHHRADVAGIADVVQVDRRRLPPRLAISAGSAQRWRQTPITRDPEPSEPADARARAVAGTSSTSGEQHVQRRVGRAERARRRRRRSRAERRAAAPR